jgi:hypothetical protein
MSTTSPPLPTALTPQQLGEGAAANLIIMQCQIQCEISNKAIQSTKDGFFRAAAVATDVSGCTCSNTISTAITTAKNLISNNPTPTQVLSTPITYNEKSNIGLIVGSAAGSIVALLFISIGVFIYRKKKNIPIKVEQPATLIILEENNTNEVVHWENMNINDQRLQGMFINETTPRANI